LREGDDTLMFSENFIAELKEKSDIESIISEYVDLNRKGRNLMGICPFHAERTASFCVYPSNGSFYCFGCGAGGDVITFLRLAEHYDYTEAVKFLAERAGMNVELNEKDDEVYRKKLLFYKINRDAAKFFFKSLVSPEGKAAVEYLKSRHISSKTIKSFGLGYSPPSGYALTDYLLKMGYKSEDIISVNLGFEIRNKKLKDRFKNRLMFPIMDIRGNVVAFGARTLSNEIPKYVNTSDTLIFKKSDNLFSLNFAKNSESKNLILTEGYMDTISLHQSGFKNSVAGLGTALTLNQVKLLSRYTDEVVLCYDSDLPGQKAAKKAMDMLRNNGIRVKILSIPQAKDPDEYIRNNGENGKIKFEGLIENSKNDVEFQISKLKDNLNMDLSDDKIKYLKEASKIISLCGSAIEKDIYISKLSEETGVNKSSISIQVEKYVNINKKKTKKKEFKNIQKFTSAINDKVNKEKHSNLRAASAEETILSYVINNPSVANNILSRLKSDMFITELNRRIYISVSGHIKNGNFTDLNSVFQDNFSLEEIGRITKIACSYNASMSKKSLIDECINILEVEKLKNSIYDDSKNISENEAKIYIEKLKNIKK